MPTMILYHGTDRVFDRFDPEFFGSQNERASNGALGVWLGVDRDLAERFGDVLDVETKFDNVFRMPVGVLRKHHNDCCEDPAGEHAYYRKLRDRMMSEGYDAVAIVEQDNSVDMYVGLDLEKLTITARHQAELVAGPKPF